MNFEEYWIFLMKVKPIKEEQKVLMTRTQFKNMLYNSFKKGFYQGLASLKKKDNLNNTNNPIEDIFKNLFGGSK